MKTKFYSLLLALIATMIANDAVAQSWTWTHEVFPNNNIKQYYFKAYNSDMFIANASDDMVTVDNNPCLFTIEGSNSKYNLKNANGRYLTWNAAGGYGNNRTGGIGINAKYDQVIINNANTPYCQWYFAATSLVTNDTFLGRDGSTVKTISAGNRKHSCSDPNTYWVMISESQMTVYNSYSDLKTAVNAEELNGSTIQTNIKAMSFNKDSENISVLQTLVANYKTIYEAIEAARPNAANYNADVKTSIENTLDGITAELKDATSLSNDDITTYNNKIAAAFKIKVENVEVPGTEIKAENIWGTFVSPIDRVLPEGITAYVISSIGTELTLEAIAKDGGTLTKDTPCILKSTTGATLAPATDCSYDVTDIVDGNYLVGVYAKSEVPENAYVLQSSNDGMAFYKVTTTGYNINPNRCYIKPQTNLAKASFKLNNGVVTGIEALNSLINNEISEVYSTNGAKQDDLKKGVNIVRLANGKTAKILVK